MSQTLTYVIGSDRRTNVDNIQDFKVDFGDDNHNWVQARQFERGMRQVFVNVTNADGTPFDLTGCNVWFEGLLPNTANGDFRVIDSAGYVPLDPSAGQFRFDMPGQAFTVAGSYRQAFFRIVKGGNSVTTLEFDLDVLADKVIDGLIPKDWIGPFETIADQLVDGLQNHTNAADKIISDFQQKVTDLVNQLNQQGSTTTSMLTELQNRITNLETQIKQDNLFTQAEANAFEQSIESNLSNLCKVYEHTYPTLADLQADKNIISGQVVKTGGYYALNDGGSAIYDVTNAKPNGYYETLQNGLYAALRYTSKVINVAQFGVSPSQSDNYTKLQMIFDNYSQDANIYFPNGLYQFSNTLILDKTYCRLVGDARTELQKTTTNLAGYTCIFNGRTIDLSTTDIALIVGPANKQNETAYHHQVKFESMRFSSPDITNPARSNYGIVAIGTAYMSFDNCFLYGFYLNLKQYESFGFNLSQTQSNGALTASLFLDKCVHVSANGCGFESTRPQASAVVLTNGSIATIADSVITMNGVYADSNSDLTLVGGSYETNYQTFRATAGSTISVTGGDIERHQDPANDASTPLIYCTDSSKVSVTNANWRWRNYTGQPTWDHLSAYQTNAGCKIVVVNCQFDSSFPKLTHYDGGATYVVWDNDLDIYKQYTSKVTPMDGVTVQGQTLTRGYGGQCFLNIGFTTTKDFNYMDPLISFPPSYIPWDSCYIQFLQQNTKATYQAFTQDGKIKVYDTVPSGTSAMLTFSYQAKD